jgi:UDP-N-acetylmuramate dehydrogenase
MVTIHENISLLALNTFGINASARYMAFPVSSDEVVELAQQDRDEWNPKFVLGGGSNVLFTGNYNGLIIHPQIKGIEKTKENDEFVWLRAGCAETWDDFVHYCVAQDLGGLENLSLIPGTVGASPVQNIGAYGVEVRDCIDRVEMVLWDERKKTVMVSGDCRFGYRDSIFKRELKDKTVITHVTFRLNKNHLFKTHYPDLEKELDNYSDTTIQYIREAIISIRRNKLPDPSELGNAGSFFKNPVITLRKANALLKHYPSMPLYNMESGDVKVSAAWLIEQCHWKGRRIGSVESYKKQPLVIVKRGGASGGDILDFARRIQRSVQNLFGISLEMEVIVL